MLFRSMLTCNKLSGRLPVPDEYRRRAVVLDTDPLLDLLDDLDLELRKLRHAGGPPRLDLTQLVPSAFQLDQETFLVLRELLQQFLTPDGWTLANLQSLELLVLGYAPLMGDAPREASAVSVAMDYLSCADTVGEARAGWQGPFLAAANEIAGAGGGDLVAALERASRERRQIDAVRGQRHSVAVREKDALTARRAELVAELRLSEQDLDARKLPRERKVAGAGLRATLRKLREEAGYARSGESLDDVAQRARAKLQETRALVDALAAERRSAEQAKLDADRERKRARAAARDEKARGRRELMQLRSQLKELERLYRRRRTDPAERPIVVLKELGLVAYAEVARQRNERKSVLGTLSSLFDTGPSGWWYAPRAPDVRFLGDRAGARELAQWGEGTQRLIAVALAPLHERERELERKVGVAPRKAREQLRAADLPASASCGLGARAAGRPLLDSALTSRMSGTAMRVWYEVYAAEERDATGKSGRLLRVCVDVGDSGGIYEAAGLIVPGLAEKEIRAYAQTLLLELGVKLIRVLPARDRRRMLKLAKTAELNYREGRYVPRRS